MLPMRAFLRKAFRRSLRCSSSKISFRSSSLQNSNAELFRLPAGQQSPRISSGLAVPLGNVCLQPSQADHAISAPAGAGPGPNLPLPLQQRLFCWCFRTIRLASLTIHPAGQAVTNSIGKSKLKSLHPASPLMISGKRTTNLPHSHAYHEFDDFKFTFSHYSLF